MCCRHESRRRVVGRPVPVAIRILRVVIVLCVCVFARLFASQLTVIFPPKVHGPRDTHRACKTANTRGASLRKHSGLCVVVRLRAGKEACNALVKNIPLFISDS